MFFLNFLTFGLWGKLGKIVHYSFDAIMISTILAGMRRSTGLTIKKPINADNSSSVNYWMDRYLGVGETVLDTMVATCGTSSYFERKR